jgi:exodeoxyribonuclease VII large subunit
MLLKSLDESKQNFGDNAARLEVLSPLKTLARGYSVASRYDNGSVVTDVAALTVGDRLRVKLYHGGADCRVESLDGCIDFGDDHGNA